MPARKARLLNDCFDHGNKRLTHAAAIELLRERVSLVTDTETVGLEAAVGRICAAEIASARQIPAHDNSAVDGYAYRSSDHARFGGKFSVSERIAAGDARSVQLAPGSTARIFTGAIMPRGADTVAMQEDCTIDSRRGPVTVSIPAGLKPGANRRLAGEDVKPGDILAKSGSTLRPQEIAALASAGLATVPIRERLRIGVFSSGEEIRQPGESLGAGQVYDANRFLLSGLLSLLPAKIENLGVMPDNARTIRRALAGAAEAHDAIITTGGASRGEEDHLSAALQRIGKRHLWQLAVKPGRPMCFGQIADCAVFSLPGNPVAAFVCYLLYVRPALISLGGGNWHEPQRFPVMAGFDFPRKKRGRREFWRAWLEHNEDGTPVAMKFEKDGSGLITGLRQATGLIETDEDATQVLRGESVRFIPFSEFGII